MNRSAQTSPHSQRRLNLSHERLNRGLSLRQAAKHIGVSQQTLSRLESGARVRPENAKLVADFYGVRVTDLLQEAA